MATLDDSPSLFSGQQWTEWANAVLPEHENEASVSCQEDDSKNDTDSMKLRKEDMPLFGVCPSQDEFYLVVCEKCKLVVKPQAFQEHLNVRHGGKGSCGSKIHHTHRRSVSKSHGRPSHSARSSADAPTTKRPPLLAAALAEKPMNLAPSVASHILTKASVKEPPLELSVQEPPPSSTATTVGAGLVADRLMGLSVKDSKLTVNHALPVVKVERMPETLAMKKQRESTGSARTSLTNGAIRQVSLSPVSQSLTPGTLVSGDDIKPAASPSPALSDPHSPTPDHSPPSSPVPVSEITSAVSAILEPISPAVEPAVALVTFSSTLPTTTVTMANITTASTTVTNVTSTTSSFTFSSLSRPHIPMGSIRVSFSNTGVLSALKAGVSSLNASRNSANIAARTSVNTTLTNGLQSNLSVSSTVEPIVTTSNSTKSSLGTYSPSNTFKSSFSARTSSPSPVRTSSISGVTSVKSHTFTSLGLSSGVKHRISPSHKHSGISTHSGGKHGAKTGPHGHGATHLAQRTSVVNIGTIGSTSSIPSTAAGGGSTANPQELLKKFPLMEKPDKIIPLKDREFDPNKHCGVICADTAKFCTRSLTCKTHALSLRRAVTGRRLPFDELLQEHRDFKEAFMKAKQESKEAAMAAKAAAGGLNKAYGSSPVTSPLIKPNVHPFLTKENRPAGSGLFPQGKISPQKMSTNSAARPNLDHLHMPSLSLRDEMWSPSEKPPDKLLIDDEDEVVPKDKDDSYTTHHPRPIAACSFGARNHSIFGGSFGCHMFSRRSDHLRSSFLDLLERHLHPPPPKKLCVESNLPKESDSQVSKDPYDFDVIKPARSRHLQQQQPALMLHKPPTVITPVINKAVPKKAKPSNVCSPSVSKPKPRDAAPGSRSPGAASGSGPPSVKKRRFSGSGVTVVSSVGSTTHPATPLSTPLVTSSNIIGNITVTSSAGGNPAFAIAIPNVSISGANVINATLGNSRQLNSKNNLFKDLGFVVTGISQDAILNGQYLNISNSQLGELGSTQVMLDEKSSLNQTNVIARNKTTSAKYINSINSIDTVRAMPGGKNNLIQGLPPNTLLLDGGLQPGTVLTPVSLTTPANHMGSVGHMSFSSHQQSPGTTPSPHLRSGSVSPQVSSPLPNGVISAAPEKELLISQRHQMFQSKGLSHPHIQRGTSHQTLQLHPGTQHQSQNFSFPGPAPVTSVTNQINASQVLTSQFSQFQMKNSAIQKTAGGKVTMQPMSLTIPFSAGNLSLGGPHSTVFITSEDAQKQGIHIRQSAEPQAQNSPSGTLIS